MSRRNNRKKESNLKIWLPIVCIIIVGITFFMLYDIKGKIKKMEKENPSNTASLDNETKDEKMRNEIKEENIVENIISENTISNTAENKAENTISNNTSNTSNSAKSKTNGAGITDKKQAAIELVKEEWGKDSTVDFVFDYVNENGEYVVAVRDKNLATIKCYYRVNLDNETVELD